MFVAAVLTAATILTPPQGWVCSALDSNPTQDGVWELILSAYQRGYSSQADAERLVTTVQSQCPKYIPLLIEWANAND